MNQDAICRDRVDIDEKVLGHVLEFPCLLVADLVPVSGAAEERLHTIAWVKMQKLLLVRHTVSL